MSAKREAVRFVDRFDRAQALTTTPGVNGWTVKDTSAAGAPTYLTTADGMVLTLAATSEAEHVTMYQNDILILPIERLKEISFDVEVAGIDAVTTLSIGVGSAQNNDEDAMTVSAWLKMEGSVSTANLVAESDDNVTNNDDKATGKTLSTAKKRVRISFERGLSDVRFYVDGDRVAAGTTFDMSGITAGQGVQPFVQLSKASGTGTPSVTIRRTAWEYNYVAV